MGEQRAVASLWFVTPAWRRFALSAVCFEQRRQVIAELATQGVEAHCVVVADDENLDLARAAGFETVEQNNDWLGRRFNDGFQYAGEHGADWIVPVGSDSWVEAAYFLPLPTAGHTRTSRYLATVTHDRLAHLEIKPNHGGGPYVLPRALFERSGFRPGKDLIGRNIDRSIVDGLSEPPRWELHDLHRLQHVSFRGDPHLTRYEKLWYYWGVQEDRDPWDQLVEHYPVDLVARAQAALVPLEAVA
jgi:hypothetical protein